MVLKEKNILVLGNVHEKIRAFLKDTVDSVFFVPADEVDGFLQEHGQNIQVVLSSAYTGLKTEWIAQLPHLEVVVNFGVGYDSTDIHALKARGIPFSNTPNVLNDAVADTALALLLATMRRVTQADQFVRSACWEKKEIFPLTPNVSHKKVGIIGLGSIGQVIAKRLQGFDCEIAYHNRRARPELTFSYYEHVVDLARWADILIVATVGGAETKHLVNEDILHALGEQGYLINIARGSVIDEQALIKALQSGTIAGAGLDVFENEPFVPEALKKLSNVVLMPHLASATIETREAMATLVLQNLVQFYEQGHLLTPV